MLKGLMLHTGAAEASVEQVNAVKTPARTKSWVPVPHGTLLQNVRGTLGEAGLSVVSESHGLWHGGDRYFGLLHVKNGSDDGDFGLVVGIRNSHDRVFPAGLVFGAQVFVCDNLSFSGEVRLARKHTSRIEADLPGLVNRAVGQLSELRQGQARRFAAYKQHELGDKEAHDFVVRALDSGILPVTHIPTVLKEWRAPRHPEFQQTGKTAWRLLQAFTETFKGNLPLLPRRTQALQGMLDGACGLVTEAAVPQLAQGI
jgi:hypothetical protein